MNPRAGEGEITGWVPQGVCTDYAVYPREWQTATKEEPRGGYRRASARTPRYTPRKWQTPRRTSQPDRRLEPFTLHLTNRFSQLPETELAGEVHPDI